jgi:hypothetical protein
MVMRPELTAFVNVVVASICFRQPFAPVLHPSADSELPGLQAPSFSSDLVTFPAGADAIPDTAVHVFLRYACPFLHASHLA